MIFVPPRTVRETLSMIGSMIRFKLASLGVLAIAASACSSKHATEEPPEPLTTATVADPCFAGRGEDLRRCADYAEPMTWAFHAECIDVRADGPLAPGWPYRVNPDGTKNPRPDYIADCVSANPMPGENRPTIICCP